MKLYLLISTCVLITAKVQGQFLNETEDYDDDENRRVTGGQFLNDTDDDDDDDDEYENRRVIGGQFSPALPFFVLLSISLVKNKYLYCGGSLLTPNGAVTAAHCVYDCIGITAFFGSQKKYSGVRRTAKAWMWHKKFHPIILNDDVAVLVWNEPIPQSNTIRPIAISPPPTIGSEVVVAGFGLTERKDAPDFIKSVVIRTEKKDVCKKALSRKGFFEVSPEDSYICANVKPGSGACKGDSGGPLYLNHSKPLLVGIVSYGPRDCNIGSEYYTSASYFQKWIFDGINCLRTKHHKEC